MLASIGGACAYGYSLLEIGLAHPTFLGRLVSWGVFYGALNYSVQKIYAYVAPKFQAFTEGHCWCICHKDTPKGDSGFPSQKVEHKKETSLSYDTSTPTTSEKEKTAEVVKKKST